MSRSGLLAPPTIVRATRLPWKQLLAWSLLGSVLCIGLVLYDASRFGLTVVNMLQAGRNGPSHVAFEEDFHEQLPEGIGHDAQQFYAIARQPMHPDAVQRDAPNTRYRMQRIVFPLLAWAVQPTGGGTGLGLALIIISFASVFLGSLTMGALVMTLGGKPWSPVLYGLIPGIYISTRLTLSDSLAMALLLGAIALSLRRHHAAASVVAVVAALTKEIMLIPLVAFALWRRDKHTLTLAVPAVVASAAWYLTLAALLPDVEHHSDATLPFRGWSDAIADWTQNEGGSSLIILLITLGLVIAVFVKRRHSPLLPSILVCAVLPIFLDTPAISMFNNVSRTILPAMLLAVIALLGTAGRTGERREVHPGTR